MNGNSATEKPITQEMREVLEHMRYDKATDSILIDCNLSCKIKVKVKAVHTESGRH